MNTPQTVFTVLYSIMWGAQVGAFGRWKMFDTGRFCQCNEEGVIVRCRFYWSTLCLALVPVVYLALWLASLSNSCWDKAHGSLSSSLFIVILLAGLCAYFPLPAFYRFWLCVVQRCPTSFYPYWSGILTWERQFPNLLRQDLDRNQAFGNLIFGLIYLVVSIATGAIARRLVVGYIW